MSDHWTAWSFFSNDRGHDIEAPGSPGVYEVCDAATRERVAFGCTHNIADALRGALMPTGLRKWLSFGRPHAAGDVEYRVWPTTTFADAKGVIDLIHDRREAMLRHFGAARI